MSKKIRYLSLLLAGLLYFTAHGKAPSLTYITPYVNRISNDQATIIWMLDKNISTAKVKVLQGESEFIQMSPKMERLKKKSLFKTKEYFRYSANISNLSPGNTYTYHITLPDQKLSGNFTTPPPAGNKVNFVVYGDVRDNPDSHQLVAESIARANPEFVLCVGDLTARGKKWNLWKKEFFDPARSYLNKTVLWPVRGNHEDKAKNYTQLFDLPGNELYYSFNAGDVHIVVLDSEGKKSEKTLMQEWLKKDLQSHTQKWTIVLYHKPTFNVSGHGSKWGRKSFLPIMQEGKVDLVITGHSHLYERFVPIGAPDQNPMTFIVTGGGGAPFHKPRKKPSPALATGKSIAKLHHINFEVHNDTLQFVTQTPTGQKLDSLRLVKSAGSYQKSVQPSIPIKKIIQLID